MWLLLYREWDCFSRVMWGILFHITQHPTVVSESLHPAAGFVFAIPAAIFFRVGCNRDGSSGTLVLLSSRLIDGMGGTGIVWYSFPRALGVKFPVWITDNGVVGVGTVSPREWWVPIG